VTFVDTGAWFAAFVPNDPDHTGASDWLAANREVLVTSDYVFDELMTLFKIRGEYERALIVGPQILHGQIARLIWVTPDDAGRAWELYSRFRDKKWSFTDCVSYVQMQRLMISTAFSFDAHFRQFGTATVVP